LCWCADRDMNTTSDVVACAEAEAFRVDMER
jgi:hypothetical protein